ncbi:envelope glycoprotein gp160 [Sphingopyxis sp. EG6]|nr:envelope glycoprotein gp160 [Sphingopyxis sp. EG6]
MRREIDERRQESCERLPRTRRRDKQRMLAPLARPEHIGLMPPESPPARGEPVGEGGGEAHGADVAVAGRGGKRFG